MAGNESMMESVAGELLGWLQSESKWYADAIRNGGRAPFSAPASEAEKLEYYRRQMFEVAPDGTIQYDKPNKQGRSEVLARLGVDGYTRVYDAVKPPRGMRPVPEEAADLEGEPQDGADNGGYFPG